MNGGTDGTVRVTRQMSGGITSTASSLSLLSGDSSAEFFSPKKGKSIHHGNTNSDSDSLSLASSSRRVVEEAASENLERYFREHAERIDHALQRGRHPKSLSKDSELWMYDRITTDRLSRVRHGGGLMEAANLTAKQQRQWRAPSRSTGRRTMNGDDTHGSISRVSSFNSSLLSNVHDAQDSIMDSGSTAGLQVASSLENDDMSDTMSLPQRSSVRGFSIGEQSMSHHSESSLAANLQANTELLRSLQQIRSNAANSDSIPSVSSTDPFLNSLNAVIRSSKAYANAAATTVGAIIGGTTEELAAAAAAAAAAERASLPPPPNPLDDIDLDSRVQIPFGMPFVLIGPGDVVLCVTRHHEVIAKHPLSILPTDRWTFRAVDLPNPSNPKAVEFGDAMWLQPLQTGEGADNSFQAGYVLTSKLFSPPTTNGSVSFETNSIPNVQQNDTNGTSNRKRGKGNATKDGSQSGVWQQRLHQLEEESAAEAEAAAKRGTSSRPASPTATTTATTTNKGVVMPAVDASRIPSLCGHANVTRIVELRKEGMVDGLSDEKALRFNSRQSLHLGKFTLRNAGRPSNIDFSSLEAGVLYSNLPVVIQQDQYCLSAADTDEYDQWPPTSSSVIRSSGLLSSEMAEEYEQQYVKYIANNGESVKVRRSVTSNSLSPSKKSLSPKKSTAVGSNSFSDNGGKDIGKENSQFSSMETISSPKSSDPTGVTHGCLRRIVPRGQPYEYLFDRRCVWRLCVYKQYSEKRGEERGKDRGDGAILDEALISLHRSKLKRSLQRNGPRYQETDSPLTRNYLRTRRALELNADSHFKSKMYGEDSLAESLSDMSLNRLPNLVQSDTFLTEFGGPSLVENSLRENRSIARGDGGDGVPIFAPPPIVNHEFIRTAPDSGPDGLSEEIKSVFSMDVGLRDKRLLILNGPSADERYRTLTNGERVMTLHRTMHKIHTSAARKAEAPVHNSGGYTKSRNVLPAVQNKLERLTREDERLVTILQCRDAIERKQLAISKFSSGV